MAPLVKRIQKKGRYEVSVYAVSPATSVFDSAEVGYTSYDADAISPNTVGEILDQYQPNLIIGGTSPQGRTNQRGERIRYAIEQVAIQEGNVRSIPTISIGDYWGIGEQRLRYSDIIGNEELCYLPHRVAALDALHKEHLLADGITEDNIVVTGNPQHDILGEMVSSWTEERRGRTRRDLGLTQYADHVVTYVGSIKSQMLGWQTGFWDMDCVEALCEGLDECYDPDRGLYLMIRRHPGENSDDFDPVVIKAQKSRVPVALSLVPYDPHTVILASDLIVGPRSNMITDATLMDRDALSLQPGKQDRDPLVTNIIDVTPHAYTRDEAVRLTQKMVVDSPTRNSYREKRKSFTVDGKATERVMALVDSIFI